MVRAFAHGAVCRLIDPSWWILKEVFVSGPYTLNTTIHFKCLRCLLYFVTICLLLYLALSWPSGFFILLIFMLTSSLRAVDQMVY